MSKYRPGFSSNSNKSALNKDDTTVNSKKLFDGCVFIFYTSRDPVSRSALTLNTSDATEPKLVKQNITDDKKDEFQFKTIASDDGYLIQGVKSKLYLVPTSSKSVYGSTTKSGVWKFTNVGYKSDTLTCKLQSTTVANSKDIYLTESGDNVTLSDKGDTEISLGIMSLGKNAFAACIDTDPQSQGNCCKGTIGSSNSKYSICKDANYIPGSSKCPANKTTAKKGNFEFLFGDIASGASPQFVKKSDYICVIVIIIIIIVFCLLCAYMHRGSSSGRGRGGRRR